MHVFAAETAGISRPARLATFSYHSWCPIAAQPVRPRLRANVGSCASRVQQRRTRKAARLDALHVWSRSLARPTNRGPQAEGRNSDNGL